MQVDLGNVFGACRPAGYFRASRVGGQEAEQKTSRSTTEAEMVSPSTALFSEALPTLQLWEVAIGRKVQLVIMEDNSATISIL